jgi:hypothetical protein
VGAGSEAGLVQASHDLLTLQPQPRETAQQRQVAIGGQILVKVGLLDQGTDPAQNAVTVSR